jgi:transglutaminase-like putative cysteine protease
MKYRVNHVIRVEYEPPIRMASFSLRLKPVHWIGQSIEKFHLSVEPKPLVQDERVEPFLTNLSRFEIAAPLKTLVVKSRFFATVDDEMLDVAGPDLAISDIAKLALSSNDLGVLSPVHYLYVSTLLPFVAEIAEWARPSLSSQLPVLETSLAFAREIYTSFVYDSEATEADTPVAEAFKLRRGVCQDFAHIMISALRSAGVPAAYVSGYLRTEPPPGQKRLVGVDGMHAWVAVWCGAQRGWVGIDPTNGCIAGSGHLTVAIGRDYADVSPIDGIFIGGGQQRIKTSVDVVPLD